jgi:hypothetical protein
VERVFEDSVDFSEGFLHVTLAQLEVVADVGALSCPNVSEVGEGARRSELRMEHRGAGFYRLENIHKRLKRFILNLHQLQGVFGHAPVYRSDRHDGFTDVKDAVDGENGLVTKCRAIIRIHAGHSGDIGPREYRGDAAERLGAGFVDTSDAGIRVGASQNRDVEHPGHFDIPDMQHLAGGF